MKAPGKVSSLLAAASLLASCLAAAGLAAARLAAARLAAACEAPLLVGALQSRTTRQGALSRQHAHQERRRRVACTPAMKVV